MGARVGATSGALDADPGPDRVNVSRFTPPVLPAGAPGRETGRVFNGSSSEPIDRVS